MFWAQFIRQRVPSRVQGVVYLRAAHDGSTHRDTEFRRLHGPRHWAAHGVCRVLQHCGGICRKHVFDAARAGAQRRQRHRACCKRQQRSAGQLERQCARRLRCVRCLRSHGCDSLRKHCAGTNDKVQHSHRDRWQRCNSAPRYRFVVTLHALEHNNLCRRPRTGRHSHSKKPISAEAGCSSLPPQTP